MTNILASAGRTNIYNQDGTGRDTYVSQNNGGFSIMNNPRWQQKIASKASGVPPAHSYFRRSMSSNNHKPVFYPVNGTGRDAYISSNCGGFFDKYNMQNASDAYVNSLRDNLSPQQRFQIGGKETRKLSPTARYNMNLMRTNQKNTINRLSVPKHSLLDDDEQGYLTRISGGQIEGNSPVRRTRNSQICKTP